MLWAPATVLEYQVLREIEAAEQEGRILIGNYPSEEQKALSQDLIAFEDVSERTQSRHVR